MTQLETVQQAKRYMDKLARGIDPITDAEMPEDATLNNVRLARCFFYVADVLQRVIDNGGTVGSKPKRLDFALTPQQLAQIKVSAYSLRIGEFVDALYRAAENPDMRKPSTTVITNWLLEKGFLKKENKPDGKYGRYPTEAGRSIGIYTQKCQGQYGEYVAVYYNSDAQRFLLDNLDAILRESRQRRNG